MTITYTIPGATPLNQLSEPTQDGQPDENARNNCVAASIAEGLHILTGQTFDGDELKDAVYGQGYTGVMAAASFANYCAAHGVSLTPHNDSQAGLVATLTAEVAKGHPVLVTMPSQWGTAPVDPVHPSGCTHVGCAVGFGPSEIRVMNPWGGFWQDESDAWWAARICYGQIWIMARMHAASTPPQENSNMAIVRNADGTATDSDNGLKVFGGIAEYIFTHNLEGAHLLTGEVSYTNNGQHQTAVALSNGVVVRWYGNGADENAAAVMTGLMGEIDSAQQTTSATHAQLVDAQSQIAALHSQLTQAQAALADAQAALAAEKANSSPPAPIQPSTPPSVPAPSAGAVSASGAASSTTSPTQGASIVNIFQKAWANINMTPQERALLRLIEGWLWAGVLAAFGVVLPLIASGHLVVNQTTLGAIAGAGLAAVMSAVKKYVSAHGDLLNSSGS